VSGTGMLMEAMDNNLCRAAILIPRNPHRPAAAAPLLAPACSLLFCCRWPAASVVRTCTCNSLMWHCSVQASQRTATGTRRAPC
jgi:hypothetical protein